MEEVRVRFAPSPTGYLHIGGARTALFNWLFAKKHGGRFILRIEDTDTERLKEDSVSQILASLRWLGLDWDEGPEKEGRFSPYYQSQRSDNYKKYLDWLLRNKKAYMCFCTPEELEKDREAQKSAKKPFRYAKTCRHLTEEEVQVKLDAGLKPVIRLRVPEQGDILVHDLIHGTVTFQLNQFDDFIIYKSNGMPTYNFACVADDHAMKISHVLRAEEHLSNTPKQLLLYAALNIDPPQFAHLPMILAPDRSKLSKRHGATSVEEFRAQGYLAPSIVNYLTLLGWAPGDEKEFFALADTVESFRLEDVSKKAAVYDVKKLAWMNGQYLSSLPLDTVFQEAMTFLLGAGVVDKEYAKGHEAYLRKLVDIVRVRVKNLAELADVANCFLRDLSGYEEKGAEKHFTPKSAGYLSHCLAAIEKEPAFDKATLESIYEKLTQELGVKLGELVHPSRLALTGRTVSPGLFDVMILLGREKTLQRLKAAISYIG